MKRFLFILLLPVLFFGQVNAQKIQPSFRPVITAPISDEITGGFCQEYQAVYDAYTTKPDATYSAIWNTMIDDIQTKGPDPYWDSLDVFYFYAVHTNAAGEALINWELPGTFDATAYNAPTHTAYEGFTGADTKYIDCNWNPSVNGVNYVQNSASVGCYIRTDVDEAKFDMGVKSAHTTYLQSKNGGNVFARVNSGGGGTGGVVANSLGMFIANRVLASHQDVWKNKVRVQHVAEVSTGVPQASVYTLAFNNGGPASSFISKQLSLAFAGSGLSTTAITTITDAVETCMDAMGKGVISESPTALIFLFMLMLYVGNHKRFNYENMDNDTDFCIAV